MKNFFKLVNFELNRFMKLYVVLLIVILLVQILGTIIVAKNYMNKVNSEVIQGGMSQFEFMQTYSLFSMQDVTYSMLFMIPIAIGVAALLFYLFFIWYRDWFAQNTFIYRLLMLPTARMNIFLAKLTVIMLTVLGLVVYQIILLMIQINIVKWIVPKVYRVDVTVAEITNFHPYLRIIIPQDFTEFLIAYGIGLCFVVVMFTAILMERSFRLKGIIVGVLYIFTVIFVFALPFIIQYMVIGKEYLYVEEMFAIEIVLWLMIVFVSLFISSYLLKNRVTV